MNIQSRMVKGAWIASFVLLSTATASAGHSIFWNMQAPSGSMRAAVESLKKDPAVAQFLASSQNRLDVAQVAQDAYLATTKFQHFYKGIEVLGSMAFVHEVGGRSRVSDWLVRFDLDTHPGLALTEILSVISPWVEGRNLKSAPQLKILPTADLSTARLVYWLEVSAEGIEPGFELILDANSGALVAQIPHRYEIDFSFAPEAPLAGIDVWDASQVPDTDVDEHGNPIRLNWRNMKRVIQSSYPDTVNQPDDSALRALTNSTATLSYYSQVHDRNSFDDQGSSIVNIVHIGRKWGNAFWDSERKIMAYGDGDGQLLDDLTKGLDVAGHEMTHGVVSNTAALMYMDESGALNEAIADFFGKMIENEDDWVIGRKVWLSKTSSRQDGIRNIMVPGAFIAAYQETDGTYVRRPYPAHFRDKFESFGGCEPRNDNCYVHANSTIPSHATYLLTKAIGRQRAEVLLYTTLVHRLRPMATFRDFGGATRQTCRDIFSGYICQRVNDVFNQVGL